MRLGKIHHRPLTIILFCVLIVAPIPIFAENGRDFAGHLSVTDVVGGGAVMTVSFNLEIFNYSGGDVSDGKVRVEQWPDSEPIYESQIPLAIPYRERSLISEPVLVLSRQNYERWRQGELPMVRISYIDENEIYQSRNVELAPRIVEREGQQ